MLEVDLMRLMMQERGVFTCGFKGCDYKSKLGSNVRIHKAFVHDIDFRVLSI